MPHVAQANTPTASMREVLIAQGCVWHRRKVTGTVSMTIVRRALAETFFTSHVISVSR